MFELIDTRKPCDEYLTLGGYDSFTDIPVILTFAGAEFTDTVKPHLDEVYQELDRNIVYPTIPQSGITYAAHWCYKARRRIRKSSLVADTTNAPTVQLIASLIPTAPVNLIRTDGKTYYRKTLEFELRYDYPSTLINQETLPVRLGVDGDLIGHTVVFIESDEHARRMFTSVLVDLDIALLAELGYRTVDIDRPMPVYSICKDVRKLEYITVHVAI